MYHQRHRLQSSGWTAHQRVTGHISTGDKDIQYVVGTGRSGCGRDTDGGSGGVTNGGREGERQDGDGLNWWLDNVEKQP